MKTAPHPSRRPHGVALIEAMVALVIMAFGMVALVGLQGNLRRSADVAKQRGEAIRLAQQNIEDMRAFSVLTKPVDPPENMRGYDDDIVTVTNGVTGDNARYALIRTVTPWAESTAAWAPAGAAAGMQALSVSVSWSDRANATQRVTVDSFVARLDPGLSGSLSIAPANIGASPPGGRHPAIPTAAKDLGGGISVFKPQTEGTVAWVFNNLTGVISRVCSGIAFAKTTSELTVEDLTSCTDTLGYLLSGYVRFSTVEPPSSDAPVSNAMPLDMKLTVSTDHVLTPTYQCFDNAPADSLGPQTVVGYYCIVYPTADAPRIWSGRLDVSGIALGATGSKICRYSADYDGDELISNAEHPASYTAVGGSLTRQNFLVIKGSSTCPDGRRRDVPAGIFSDTKTVLHQES